MEIDSNRLSLRLGERALNLDWPAAKRLEKRPFVLVFSDAWSPANEAENVLIEIGAELRGMSAAVLILANAGIFVFGADDEVECVEGGALARSRVARMARWLGVAGRNIGEHCSAIFVFDSDHSLCSAFAPSAVDGGMGLALLRALRTADQTLHKRWRGFGMVSRRKLVVSSLALGIALAFAPA